MDYKEMFEAVERKLNAELRIYQKIRAGYAEKDMDASYIDTRIESIEDIIKFTEELRRIYA